MIKEVTEEFDGAEDYAPIAVRDDRSGNTVISYSTEHRDFILSVSGKLMGPISLNEIKALVENLKDVIEMRGQYLFIKDYDSHGNHT